MVKARFSMVAFALQVVACGSDHSSTQLHGDGGAGVPAASGGKNGAGGTKASGGAGATSSGGAGGDPSVCHASNLSTAPTVCLQDFTHVKAKYAAQCISVGGYQAHCDPYDALAYHSDSTYTWCYYDTATGNLIGARSTDDATGKGGTCVAFDTSFSEPDVTSCAPASGTCPNQ